MGHLRNLRLGVLGHKGGRLFNIKVAYLAAVAAIALQPVTLFAAPAQPTNLVISGDASEPTLSWNAVADGTPTAVGWTQQSTNGIWSARFGHASVVFNNKLWVLGGTAQAVDLNDVWYSSDGVTWTEATASAAWSARYDFLATVFDGKMWVIGGNDGSAVHNDVWYSSDGVTWTEATASAAWSARAGTSVVVFDNRMWIVGGGDGTTSYNDVWYSSDGVTWTEAASNAAWAARYAHNTLIFDDQIWVIGGVNGSGTMFGDVWYSINGSDWTEAVSAAPWGPLIGHSGVVFGGKLWVIGGMNMLTMSYSTDIWSSSDGASWTKAASTMPWNPRLASTLVDFRDRLWISGGVDILSGVEYGDVWASADYSVSYYLVCWSKSSGGCESYAYVDAGAGALVRPTLSYTFADSLTSGTWYLSVKAVDGEGGASSPATKVIQVGTLGSPSFSQVDAPITLPESVTPLAPSGPNNVNDTGGEQQTIAEEQSETPSDEGQDVTAAIIVIIGLVVLGALAYRPIKARRSS